MTSGLTTIPLFKVHMPPRDELLPELERVLYSGYIGQGGQVEKLEAKLGKYFGNPNVLTVNSGTSAIQLALRLAGVRGGEVITTPMTCSATVLPVLAEGAVPVWADVDPDGGNIDPEDVRLKITPSTRAVLAVHWGGQPCDVSRLMEIGRANGIPVIIDAAHALGSWWGTKRTGSDDADFTCFSLQAIKHITTADGGVLALRDRQKYLHGKNLRWFGIDREAPGTDARVGADIPDWGYKFHMNDVAATIGLAQLPHLDAIAGAHQRNAAYYDRAFGDLPVKRQAMVPGATGSWWLYTLLLEDKAQRAAFQERMKQCGIMTSQVHSRLDQLTCFRPFSAIQTRYNNLPGVTSFFDREACIPVHWDLSSSDRAYVAECVRGFFE